MLMVVFLEGFGCFGVGAGVPDHDGDWIASFSLFEVEGDVLLAELRAIQMDLDFCCNKGYNNIMNFGLHPALFARALQPFRKYPCAS
jgi:hypothetical protein